MKALIIALGVLLLAGCGLNRPAVERQSFLVEPVRKAAAVATPGTASLKIGRIEVASPFADRAFVYRRDEQRYETDFYNEFAADPAAMLAQATADWLRRSHRYRTVLESGAAGAGDYRLDAAVTALYVDFRTSPATAVLAVHWRLLQGNDVARESTREERVPLLVRTPAGAASAHQEALGRALAGLESELLP